TARDIGTLIGTQTFHDVIDRNDRFDYYKFNITSESKVDFALSGKMGNTGFYLFQDWYFNSDDSTHIDRISGTPPGVVPEFSETLKPGTYYVLVHKPKDYDGDEYDLKLSAVPLDYAGNTLDNARIIPVDITTKFFKDFVGQTDGDDYYRFDLQEERQVIMTLDGFSAGATVDLLKKVPSNGQLSQLARFDNGTDVKFLDGVLDAGTYYVRVAPNSTGANTNYNFNFSALRLASGWIDSHIIPINPEPSIPQWQKDIDNTYQSARNLLGNPTGSYGQTISSLNGAQGYGRNYDYGTVYWSDRSGAIALWHGFANTYNENGGYSGWLGFPTKANENWKDGQRIDFEGGYIYWTAQDGAKAYHFNESPGLDKTVGYDGTNTHQTYVNTFNNKGGSSALGSPTGNVHPFGTENGYVQEFSGGSEGSGAIMKSGANDNSFWVGGDFWLAYQGAVNTQHDWGYPTSDRFVDENGWPAQNFQNGKIVQQDGKLYFYIIKETSSNPDPSPTQVNTPQIINRNAESGTGKLIQGLNFRNYPWLDSSSLVQGMSVGTTFTFLEKVTTTADPTLRHSDWYRVRLNDGREGYFWAGEEFIQKIASGGSAGPIGDVGIGVTPIKEGPIGDVGIGVTPIDDSNNNTPVFPYISITTAYDANDGDNFVVAGSKIILSGKTNSQNIRFYLGDIPLTQGNINFDNDNFSATLIIPPGVLPGSYQVKAVVNSPTGDATSSGPVINVQETDYSSFQRVTNFITELSNQFHSFALAQQTDSEGEFIKDLKDVTANVAGDLTTLLSGYAAAAETVVFISSKWGPEATTLLFKAMNKMFIFLSQSTPLDSAIQLAIDELKRENSPASQNQALIGSLLDALNIICTLLGWEKATKVMENLGKTWNVLTDSNPSEAALKRAGFELGRNAGELLGQNLGLLLVGGPENFPASIIAQAAGHLLLGISTSLATGYGLKYLGRKIWDEHGQEILNKVKEFWQAAESKLKPIFDFILYKVKEGGDLGNLVNMLFSELQSAIKHIYDQITDFIRNSFLDLMTVIFNFGSIPVYAEEAWPTAWNTDW
ncbi:hypothetical protein WME70_24735, partial [Microcoleus anatoxicus PTRS1]